VTWVEEREVSLLKTFLGADAPNLHLHRVDVTDEAQVSQLFSEIGDSGSPEVLANIVGGFAWSSLHETDVDTWRRMIDMNATSCFLCSRAAAAAMKGTGGRIVNVASVPALARGAANMSAYSAAKAAVLNLTLSLAEELAPAGITVNAIVPSMIDTPANRQAMPDADRSTWLPPEEIAGVVAFLASEAARIVTGTAVNLSLG